MKAFRSHLNQLNLKHLLLAVKSIRTKLKLPYYVLKIRPSGCLSFADCALSINKKVSNSTLALHQGPLTAWSTHHFHRIAETVGYRPQKRIILKNPFKSEQLIWEALSMGVKEMVISTRDQFLKIQDFKSKIYQFKNNHLNYLWMAEDSLQNIQELKSIKQQVKGLFFQAQSGYSQVIIEEITRKILFKGARINEIIRQCKFKELSDTRDWKREQFTWKAKHIHKTIDICDFSEVEKYILITRSLSQSKTVINEQAKKLIQGVDPSESCLLVDYERQRWLFSALKELPMNQQQFVFEIEGQLQTIDNLSQIVTY